MPVPLDHQIPTGVLLKEIEEENNDADPIAQHQRGVGRPGCGVFPEYAEQEHGRDRRRDIADQIREGLEHRVLLPEDRRRNDRQDRARRRW